MKFSNLLHSTLSTDAVRMNVATSSASDAECESHMKSWLRNAPDRYGGRNRRRQGKMS